jgi:hypothetical protein
MSNEKGAPAGVDQSELTTDEVAEQKELEKAEAEEAFKAGFKNVRKDNATPEEEASLKERESGTGKADEPAPEDRKPKQKQEPDASARADKKPVKEGAKPAAKPADDPLEAMSNRLRNLEGNLGGIMNKLNTMTAAPAAMRKDQPTQKEVQRALTDPQQMERLVKEFPEFKPVVEGFKATQAELARIQKSIDGIPKEAPKQQVFDQNEIRETVKLDTLHPDWEEVTRSDDFFKFSLTGGPPAAEYLQQQKIEQTDPDAAVRVINSWAQRYPDWWADKGYALFSTRAADSSKLLTKYKESTTQVSAEEQKREADALRKQTNQQRLARAKTPTGTGAAPDAGVSDNEAFRRGFQKVRR